MKITVGVLTILLGLMYLEMLRPVNRFDQMPIKCGHKLRETCPATGISWGK